MLLTAMMLFIEDLHRQCQPYTIGAKLPAYQLPCRITISIHQQLFRQGDKETISSLATLYSLRDGWCIGSQPSAGCQVLICFTLKPSRQLPAYKPTSEVIVSCRLYNDISGFVPNFQLLSGRQQGIGRFKTFWVFCVVYTREFYYCFRQWDLDGICSWKASWKASRLWLI